MQFSTILITLVSGTAMVSGLAIPTSNEVSTAGKQLLTRFKAAPHAHTLKDFMFWAPDLWNIGNPFSNDPHAKGDSNADDRWGFNRPGKETDA